MPLKQPTFTVVVEGPPGGSQRRLLNTLRDAGYRVDQPKRLGAGGGRIQVRVRAPHGEINR